MNKNRKKERHLKNKQKDIDHKVEAWENGELIEPNHNDGPYPEDYSIELGKRLKNLMMEFKADILNCQENDSVHNEMMLMKFRLYRQKIRDFIIHYNPNLPKSDEYNYLINAYETYQDEPNKLISCL